MSAALAQKLNICCNGTRLGVNGESTEPAKLQDQAWANTAAIGNEQPKEAAVATTFDGLIATPE